MATLPTQTSDQLAITRPFNVGYTELRPADAYGRQRVSYFTRTLGAEAQNSLIALCVVPKNARIIDSTITISAGPGANVNFDIGLMGRNLNGNIDDTNGATVADNTSWLGNFAPANVAAKGVFADTQANHYGYTVTKDCYLTATVKTAAVSGAAVIAGIIKYVVD